MGRQLTEEDIKQRYITPAITEQSNWKRDQIFMEYFFTDGQVMVRGKKVKRGKRKKADYLLTTINKETPLAIVEAKSAEYAVGAGMQQAIEYAMILDVPFAYSSNGFGFLEHDMLTGQERELAMDEFPSYQELWERLTQSRGLNTEQQELIQQPYHFDPFKQIKPRYYQRIAIDRTLNAIASGQNRILLVMATGTGKTFTAFQIIWRLLQTKKKKKILYLADRNVLIDQTVTNDFKPFEKIITKIQNRCLDSSFEVYMSLYQQLAGDNGEEPFRQFKPEFFDLIIVDECHRGSAKAESQWRRVLDYFQQATHIGMTATPKETKEISNITYFGDPIYTYTLKQGIEDGFLAPYKVIRVGIDIDLEGWRPQKDQTDVDGNLVEDRDYNIKDYDKNLIIDERTALVAKRVTQWLKNNGRCSKTIIFCVDIEHAERMRQAMINENSDLVKDHPNYIMRITGDNNEGKKKLDDFIDANELYPTVVTTSKLMTTGVDCKTCKLIVLENNINSMTEFKQIIGRGTRLKPENDKWYFTIMDFRGVSRLFADKDFDGEPIVIIDEPITKPDDETIFTPKKPEDDVVDGDDWLPPDDSGDDEDMPEPPQPTKKVRVNGVEVAIIKERVQFYDNDGNLVTESLIDYSKKNILQEYATLDKFIQVWRQADKKQAIVEALEEKGILFSALQEVSGKHDYDPFDLILHIAYDQKPLTKAERVNQVKKRGYLYKYNEVCQQVLSALLDKYMNEGIAPLEDSKILENDPFAQLGSPIKIAKLFGGIEQYRQAIQALQDQLYQNNFTQ